MCFKCPISEIEYRISELHLGFSQQNPITYMTLRKQISFFNNLRTKEPLEETGFPALHVVILDLIVSTLPFFKLRDHSISVVIWRDIVLR